VRSHFGGKSEPDDATVAMEGLTLTANDSDEEEIKEFLGESSDLLPKATKTNSKTKTQNTQGGRKKKKAKRRNKN